jgi:carboxylesterase
MESEPRLRSYSLLHAGDNTPRPAALLFHGLSGAPEELRELAELLHQRNCNVILPLLSGHRELRQLQRTPARAWIEDARAALGEIERQPISHFFLIGLSFGALLSLLLAGCITRHIDGIVLLSTPAKLRSPFKSLILCGLSYFPDVVLNRLGTVKKRERDWSGFSGERVAFEYHSIASIARLLQIQRLAFATAAKITAPVLALQDPEDHLVSPQALEILHRRLPKAEFSSQWIAGGEHELTIGPKQAQVFSLITEFVDRRIRDKTCPENSFIGK